MNPDSKGLQARQMIAAGDLSRRSNAKAEAFQAAIKSTQAGGYSDWPDADEAALGYIATEVLTGLRDKTGLIMTSSVRAE